MIGKTNLIATYQNIYLDLNVNLIESTLSSTLMVSGYPSSKRKSFLKQLITINVHLSLYNKPKFWLRFVLERLFYHVHWFTECESGKLMINMQGKKPPEKPVCNRDYELIWWDIHDFTLSETITVCFSRDLGFDPSSAQIIANNVIIFEQLYWCPYLT